MPADREMSRKRIVWPESRGTEANSAVTNKIRHAQTRSAGTSRTLSGECRLFVESNCKPLWVHGVDDRKQLQASGSDPILFSRSQWRVTAVSMI